VTDSFLEAEAVLDLSPAVEQFSSVEVGSEA
jgi:hypothetical protein